MFENPACRGKQDLFFPDGNQKKAAEARRLCKEVCPHLEECIEYTMSQPHLVRQFGVWAGMTSRETRVVARERRLALQDSSQGDQ